MFFASLHSSKRKFATVQYVNKERFLSPYLYSLFVIRSSALATRTVFCSFFVRSLFVFCSSFVRLLFVHCSFIVRSLFVFCSFIVRLLFVFCSSFLYLPVRLALSFVRSFFCLTFPLLHSLSLGEGWGEDIFFVFCLSACRATTSHRH